jgi:hypothetical protein
MWVILPGAHAPASVALRVIVERKPPLYDMAVVLEEEFIILSRLIPPFTLDSVFLYLLRVFRLRNLLSYYVQRNLENPKQMKHRCVRTIEYVGLLDLKYKILIF